jgi:hypothetical protein
MSEGGQPIFAALLLAGVLALAGCGGDDTSSGGGGVLGAGGSGGGGGGGTPPPVTTPPPTLGQGCGSQGSDLICLTLGSSTAGLPADSTSTATITVALTRNGLPLAGQIVDFALSSSTLGTLTAANGVSNAAGAVTTTFTAGGTIGAVGITATHAPSTASNMLALSLTQPPATSPGGIQFVSATPSTIGVVGSGQAPTASVVFRVTSPSGAATPGATVNFTMTGPSGAYIGTQDGTPTTATGITDAAGDVSIPLNAGTAAGPVTLTATVTVGGVTFTTSTSVISIGGAVPSQKWFSIATSRFNLGGFSFFGTEADLTVFVADRFSNFNVLAGTQVSFFTEAGAVDTSVNLTNTGTGVVKIRTQNPMPSEVVDPATNPITSLNINGRLRVIAVARGEEEFGDQNGNGIFDSGDTFPGTGASMDRGEPFIDRNENGVWDGPGCTGVGCIAATSPEFYVDANGNGVYDPPNGVWDGPGCTQSGCNTSPLIWTELNLVFTGDLICVVTDAVSGAVVTNFSGVNAIANGGSRTFNLTVRDARNNSPIPGTTVAISATGGTGIGTGSVTVADTIFGPFVTQFSIGDSNADPAGAGTVAGIDITVTPPGEVQGCATFSIPGFIN